MNKNKTWIITHTSTTGGLTYTHLKVVSINYYQDYLYFPEDGKWLLIKEVKND